MAKLLTVFAARHLKLWYEVRECGVCMRVWELREDECITMMQHLYF